MIWELLKYLCAGFLVITWVLILLTGVNAFDTAVLHNKDAWFAPVAALTLAAFGGYWFSSRKVK